MTNKLTGIISRLNQLKGWQRYAILFLAGAISTLAMPPIGAFYIFLLTVPCFIYLSSQSANMRESFYSGWAFGAGYFIFGLYWISFALLVDLADFWWVLPFAIIIGPTILALYYGFIPLLTKRYHKNPAIYALMFVTIWAAIEWIRGHAFTGFPWNLAGYTWQYFLPIQQTNAVVGIYGLTFLTLLWATIPLYTNKKMASGLLALFIIVAVAGLWRIHSHPAKFYTDTAIRIIQPNIAQTDKWSPDQEISNIRHQMNLTAQPSNLPIRFVIWPETAVTSDLVNTSGLSDAITRSLPQGSIGVLGSLRVKKTGNHGEYFNSVTVLDKKSQVLDTYNKHHLVPFGEYIPYRQYLNLTPVAASVAMIGDFTRGSGVRTIKIGTLPSFSPLICYEAIFPASVAEQSNRPDWLVNVTNDAWYGKTAGPHQHFEITRIRAIEEGLPLVRAANTGISGIIDPIGRIIQKADLGSEAVLDQALPEPLPATIYAQFGDKLFFLMLILCAIIGEVFIRPHQIKS